LVHAASIFTASLAGAPVTKVQSWLSEPRGQAEGPIDYFHEVSLLAEDQALGLRHSKILTRFRI
jgi:hypothetical protein